MSSVKVVVVGDEQVGKSCFIITHSTGSFPKNHAPVILSIVSDFVDENSENLTEILFYDTVGTTEFDNARQLIYGGTDVFLICFSLVDHSSLQNVLSKWHPEVRKYCPQTPIILIGLKSDLRMSSVCTEIGYNGNVNWINNRPVPVAYHEGLAVAHSIEASGYVECSAITKSGLHDINKLLEKVMKDYVGVSSPSSDDVVRGKSSLGNWITAALFFLLVFIILYSRYYFQKKSHEQSESEN